MSDRSRLAGLFVATLLSAQAGSATTLSGREFWLSIPDVASPPLDQISIEVHVDHPAMVRVEGWYPTSGNAAPGSPFRFGGSAAQAPQSNASGPWGIHILVDGSDAQVFLRKEGAVRKSDFRLAIHPVPALAAAYLVDLASSTSKENRGTVTAVADGTDVTLSNLCDSLTPLTVTLARGEAYQFVCGPDVPLRGLEIAATKPVSVVVVDGCGDVPAGVQGCDTLGYMPLAERFWGTVYYAPALPRGAGALSDSDFLHFVAAVDGTQVDVDDGRQQSVTVNRGAGVSVEYSAPAVIRSDRPIAAFVYEKGSDLRGDLGDPELIPLVAPHQYDTAARFVGESPWPTGNLLTIVAEPDQVCGIELDGQPLDPTWSAFPDGRQVHATVEVTPALEHRLTSGSPIAAYLHAHRVEGSIGTDLVRRFRAESGCAVAFEPCARRSIPLCPGDTFDLVAAVARLEQCPGGLEYRWLIDGAPEPGFDGQAALTWRYASPVVVEVVASCAGVADCDDRLLWSLGDAVDLVPGDQGNVLRAVRAADAVRLEYPDAAASEFGIYRDGGKTTIGTTVWILPTGARSLLDGGALARPGDLFYALRGVSPCSHLPGP